MAVATATLRSRSRSVSPWLSMAAILAGSYLVVLDTTVLGVALPAISRGLHASSSIGIDWVITAYLIAVGVVQPATGWLADRWGRKQVFVTALAVFTAASALSGLAPNLPMLVGARVLQGLGGGAMMPVGMAMVYELFPPRQRGTALGIWGVAIMAAPTLGPPFGGWLVTNASWRWIFLVNLPIGAVGLLMATRILRDDGLRDARPLDWLGWLLASVAVVGLVIGSRLAGEDGWGSPVTVGLLAGSTVLIAALVVRSLRRPRPLLEFRMFTVRDFSLGNLLGALTQVALYARVAFLPVELQVVRGFSAQQVGLILVPSAIAVAATMPLGGWLSDRIGSRLPVSIGLLTMSASSWFLGHVTPTTTERDLVLILVLGGLGTGLAMMPTTIAAMNALPARWVSAATVFNSLNRQIAAALGTAALAAVVVARLGAVSPVSLHGDADLLRAQSAYNEVFLVSCAITGGIAVLALLLPGRRRARRLQEERTVEHEAGLAMVEAL